MAKQITNEKVMVEYVDTSNFRKVTALRVQVEYNDEVPQQATSPFGRGLQILM